MLSCDYKMLLFIGVLHTTPISIRISQLCDYFSYLFCSYFFVLCFCHFCCV